MKKTIALSCLLASCVVLTGCSFFWKKEEKKEDVKVTQFENLCAADSWSMTLWDYWFICTFDDGSFCNTKSYLDWECKKWDQFEEVKYSDNEWILYCPNTYNPVCWENGFVYMNDCLLERQWIEKSTTLRPEEWLCVEIESNENSSN